MRAGSLGLALAAAVCAAPAWAAPQPVDADPMTVSGRFALAHADGTAIRGRLRPRAVVAGVSVEGLDWGAEAFRAALDKAAAKSLDNFGYAAGPAAEAATPVLVELTYLELQHGDNRTVARLRLKLRPESGEDACLTQEVSGQFTALRPVRTGDGQRAFGLAATIALYAASAAAGVVPTGPNLFLPEQFETASAQSDAVNARRPAGEGEGVAPDRSERGLSRFAAANAVQLAMAALIERLGRAEACRPQGVAQAAPPDPGP